MTPKLQIVTTRIIQEKESRKETGIENQDNVQLQWLQGKSLGMSQLDSNHNF